MGTNVVTIFRSTQQLINDNVETSLSLTLCKVKLVANVCRKNHKFDVENKTKILLEYNSIGPCNTCRMIIIRSFSPHCHQRSPSGARLLFDCVHRACVHTCALCAHLTVQRVGSYWTLPNSMCCLGLRVFTCPVWQWSVGTCSFPDADIVVLDILVI